ncbi:MAG: hypothetical protein QME32_01705 [Endomicrobiia bacterium]|nr:hypothetical protein [Endomicrobiia bacterium]
MTKNFIESLRRLKKSAPSGGWFKGIRIIYQGFGAMSADMFRHFADVTAVVSFYYGEDVSTHVEKRWGTKVFSYEKKKKVRHNSVGIFNDYFYSDHGNEILRFFSRLDGKIAFVPFATTKALQDFLFEKGRGMHLFQNPVIVQNYFDYKARLAWRAAEIGIPMPPDSMISFFGKLDYKELSGRYGGFVIQIPISQAGGGTDFIHTRDDFKKIIEMRKNLLGGAFDKTPVKITRYLAGPSLNCTGCVVEGSVVLSQPDIQIVGDPTITSNPAQYIGSDFSLNAFSPEHKRQMLDITERIGLWMGRNGYRGNFGVDFLSTLDGAGNLDEIYVSEVNARLVGESQYLADFQGMKDQVPLTFFHLAEFAGIDVDPRFVKSYNENMPRLEGSAIMVFSEGKGIFRAAENLKSGVYKIVGGKLTRLRDGLTLSDTKSREEFVVTNGVPWKGLTIGHPKYGDEDVCLCYLMTRESIVDPKNWKRINEKWKDAINLVREAMKLVPAPKHSIGD